MAIFFPPHSRPPNPEDLGLALVANELDVAEDDLLETLVNVLAADAELRDLVAERVRVYLENRTASD